MGFSGKSRGLSSCLLSLMIINCYRVQTVQTATRFHYRWNRKKDDTQGLPSEVRVCTNQSQKPYRIVSHEHREYDGWKNINTNLSTCGSMYLWMNSRCTCWQLFTMNGVGLLIANKSTHLSRTGYPGEWTKYFDMVLNIVDEGFCLSDVLSETNKTKFLF